VKAVDSAKPQAKLSKLADGQGLYLAITPSGTKSWRANYKVDGLNQTKTFGQYPAISLAQARILNFEFKQYLAGGLASTSPTFDEIKRDWYLHKLPMLKNIKNRKQIIYRADTFISPKIGNMHIDAIKRVILVELVREVQARGTIETAHRVASLVRQILDYAVDLGKLETHSAIGLSRILQKTKSDHLPCIQVEATGKLLRDINAFEEPITRIGLLLAAHTFVRTTELRFMRRSEIKDGKFWVIPQERMKMGLPHVVPLSNATLALLDEIDVYTGDYDYVLHSPVRPNQPISENTMLDALYSLGYRHKMCVHGFRSLASTVLNGNGFNRDVIERQLAHKETDAVRQAYNRAEYLNERIELMRWYSNWLNAHLQLT
jgi:integrase